MNLIAPRPNHVLFLSHTRYFLGFRHGASPLVKQHTDPTGSANASLQAADSPLEP
jgi:hypothetical protein